MALYYEKRNYEEIANVVEQLVVRFSSRTYWVQLSAVYSELGRDEDSLAVMELAYEQDFLESDNQLRRLAQMYLFHQVPYYAAKVVEKGLASEQIEADEEAYELLANSWLSAREYDKALSPLARAAALSQGGDLYVRLAHVRIEREEWNEARNALSSAIDKGDLRHPGNAHLLLGIANYSAKRPNAAKSAFRQARNYDDSKKSADQWLRHISREEAQEEQLIQ
jgi:tetratricopeptide (TPR) repeat protein